MSTLKIALQKSGRLNEKSIRLLKDCGINISNGTSKLKATASNFPLEILFLRDDDIPQYVEQGVADIGIVGENEVLEKRKKVDLVEPLGFAKCRMSLALPKSVEYSGCEFFDGKRVATSYPNILSEYFEKQGVRVEVEEISGSVELAPGIGLADGIFDIVSTGSTLMTNGLKEVELVLKSQAMLIGNQRLDAEKKAILKRLVFRMKAVLASKANKYILMNAPNESLEAILTLLPGMKSPTVLPLSIEGWSSIHSVVAEDDFWEIIDKLQVLGAEGILVVPLEKMIS